MPGPNVTAEEAARCLRVLEQAQRPMVAAELARSLHLGGSRESQRRHVRAIAEHLRDNGSMVVATLQQGYWLTEDQRLWKDYLEGRQIDAKRVLGETHKRKRMLADAKGQGLLFDQRIRYGVATCGVA